MNDARSIAERLAHALNDEIRAVLLADPLTAILDHFGVTIHIVDADKIAGSCGIEGRCHAQLKIIDISDRLTGRRFLFTLLHELGHYLAQHDRTTIPLVAKSPRLEENVAHAFAAELLVPQGLADQTFAETGVTAQAVANLHAASNASRWACCVRASQQMQGNGFVLVALGGVVEFAATVGTTYPLGRDAAQDDSHLINIAARHGTARSSPVRLRQSSGVGTEEYSGDVVATGDGYVFGVFTDMTPPPWGGWVGQLSQKPEWLEVDCEACDRETWGYRRCTICGDPICAEDGCGWCTCKRRPPMRERMCTECYQTRPIGQFDGDGTICSDHR